MNGLNVLQIEWTIWLDQVPTLGTHQPSERFLNKKDPKYRDRMPTQTVQAQTRLLPEELYDQCLHYLPSESLVDNKKSTTCSSNFKIITASGDKVPIVRVVIYSENQK